MFEKALRQIDTAQRLCPCAFGKVVDLPHFELDESVIDVVQRGL